MGQSDIRNLVVLGVTSVLRHLCKDDELADPWIHRMIAEKPQNLLAVELANSMADAGVRSVRNKTWRAPAPLADAGCLPKKEGF